VAEENVLGSYRVEASWTRRQVQIEVHFDFDLNGILTVTTTEGDNTSCQCRYPAPLQPELKQARADLEALFESDATLSLKDIEDPACSRTACPA